MTAIIKIIFSFLKSILPPAIYDILSKLLGAFLPTSTTPDNVASLPQLYKANTRPTTKAKVKINEKIRAAYKKAGYKWQPEKDILLIQDLGGQFNDFVIAWQNDKPVKFRCTGQGGTKTAGYWRGAFTCQQNLDLYSIASGHFPRGGKYDSLKLPYMKMKYPIEHLNLESGKLKKAKDHHVHGRASRSKNIGKSSLGCLVLQWTIEGIRVFIDIYKNKLDKVFNFSVLPVNDCQWVHEIPFFRDKTK